ncbi:hypothetical protein AURDEDRAFT_161431 [Auricularia subglabra TFB-10046 SS5]|nr:hypothetical protein AURDEDRAFT_161431 [Auricularia subglabra TFB-10046 SS5]
MIQHAKRTLSLPPELMSRILDYLELYDLHSPLVTSQNWRRVALDHPTYWRHVRLSSTSDGAIALFLSRLSHSRKRSISVELDVTSPCRRISDEVLPAIGARLSHVRTLWAVVHHEQAADLLATLCCPAPVLEVFQSYIVTPSRIPLVVLPTDIFCGNAPKLTCLSFRDIVLSDVAYAAFSKVVEVDFGFSRAETFYVVPQLFVSFPRMRRLGIYSGNANVPEDLKFSTSMPAAVEAIECNMNPHSFDFMLGIIPYHAIPSVYAGGVTDETVDFLVGQLPGELSVEVTDRRHIGRERFEISVTSTETKFRRTFGQTARRYLANVKPPISFLRDHDFAERIVALTMHNTLWGFLARHLLPFPNLRELTVRMDSPSLPVLGRTWSISCGKLQTLRLSANTVDPLYASTDRLAAFVAISLADLPTNPGPALALDAVILEGDMDVLEPHLCIPGHANSAPSVTGTARTR